MTDTALEMLLLLPSPYICSSAASAALVCACINQHQLGLASRGADLLESNVLRMFAQDNARTVASLPSPGQHACIVESRIFSRLSIEMAHNNYYLQKRCGGSLSLAHTFADPCVLHHHSAQH